MKRNRWRVSSLPMALLWGALLLFSCSQHDLRVQQLRDLQAQNQADTVFRSDSLQRILVDYFNRHGSANEKMLANYLLGRAYYDMGETPLALHYYHEAIDCADTTAADCDFKQLGRIHGQTAWLLLRQAAPQNAIKEIDYAAYFARKANDTLSIIACYNHKGSAYEKMNSLDSAVYFTKKASALYKKIGHEDYASSAEMSIADIYVRQGKTDKAKGIIDRFESFSGLFDENNRIKEGYETYYYTKGLYQLSVGKTDSAVLMFRQLILDARRTNDLECGYEGLSRAYTALGMKDSAIYYSQRAYSYNDSCHREKTSDEFVRMQSTYDYSRQQQLALRLSERNITIQRCFFISVLAFIIIVVIVMFFFIKEHHERNKSRWMLEKLKGMCSQLKREKDELSLLSENKDERIFELKKEKASEIESMQHEINLLKAKVGIRERNLMFENMRQSILVQSLLDKHDIITREESSLLINKMNEEIPDFISSLRRQCTMLSPDEELLCVLIKLRFPLKQIGVLLNRDLHNLSSTRTRLLKKVFHKNSGGTQVFDEMIKNIW